MDTKGKPGHITSSQSWEGRTSGLHSRASPSQGPWLTKWQLIYRTSALSTGIPRVQNAGETEPSQHCASVRKWAPRTLPQFTRHLQTRGECDICECNTHHQVCKNNPPTKSHWETHCGGRRACNGKGLFSVDFIPQHKPFTHGCWTWRTN